MTGYAWWDEWGEDAPIMPPPCPAEVIEVDREVIGQVYGPNGDLMAVVYDRPIVPFGFQPRGAS